MMQESQLSAKHVKMRIQHVNDSILMGNQCKSMKKALNLWNRHMKTE